ncbi:MAG TPA: bifunctional 2-C-methyl-D-erythritol 4-phosphate cytidylyltransferase/2-C-methyl-D-erythritol 2,4-cyclodiphosphate synthase [Hypericibacter adhaerens]|uniref:bifunctional 2-C-methyl-D-erythritol 4-phosphate cytidylyltransferase/2-C-methyl-D-erythritol 2,4-cyclodiphosphate synthase n=1 Tax=Hypericibacter adhaerens TaxID=2602016 RepID=UPI002CDE2065|nr:bifunctional 2-C-methyl-D-erythritol 4-phosphate cytidylyltransferase/2-C-methyl-D-erythritol 2,4-cyclodiphosphate synthase [Hypericibacter adhaerens]HWA43782.1 bifunctional 2-C-methyl-D-erythritol 4-phosphate cytidylyltransferase/2-C-methyl-D-erythritol 2,4-cyclodiphosphate synthase [Hypericibacter adhaerens]
MSGTVALIVAAGRGARFGGDVPKQYRRLGGRAVLRHAVERLQSHPGIAQVRVVISPDDRARYDEAVAGLALLPPVAGGATRQQSVRNGLESLIPLKPDAVLIHDAARPFLDAGVIDRVIEGLARAPGAIAALPVVDTIKRAKEAAGATARIETTTSRDRLWRAQTPQGFRFDAILAAHRAAAGTEHTDDAAVAEATGLAVELVMGSEENFKITTEDDLQRAERLLGGGAWEYRSASGYDVHRFAPGDAIMLCGIRVPHSAALEGHSDADVGLHALTDALLGCIGAGDIGQHFPPSDPRWRGADSSKFLAHAGELVAAKGGRIAHLDVTIICERPKVGPHRAAMIERIAQILGLDQGRVSVKATTTEGLGFTGRAEGIAAQATATVALPL